MITILGILLAIVMLYWILNFTKIGKDLKIRATGSIHEAITQDASTPEGAKAYYNAAIEKREGDYQKANDIYTQMLGKIDGYEKQIYDLKKKNMQLDVNIDKCVDKGDDDSAKVYLSEQREVTDKMDILKNAVKELKENTEIQKNTLGDIKQEIDDLKSEKDRVVLTLETSQVTTSMNPNLGSNREEYRMLEKVRDGVKKTKEKADGTRIAYESSSAVKQKKLDKQMKNDEIQKKLDELKQKKKQ